MEIKLFMAWVADQSCSNLDIGKIFNEAID